MRNDQAIELIDEINIHTKNGGIPSISRAEGRYCLNDLHKAASGASWKANDKNQPKDWLATRQAADLIGEISNSGNSPIKVSAGRNGVTYVVKELVYAYAMWISPKFHLEVIRAYDRLVTDGVAVHKNAVDDLLTNPLKYLEALMGQAKALQAEKEQLEAKVEEDAPKVEAFEEFIDSSGLCNRGHAANCPHPFALSRTSAASLGLSPRTFARLWSWTLTTCTAP
ncbi:KilA-N domain-containing protein [Chromobacterium vaccinii]|nr:KilA-N domain-containing protein [Chromobacterium vaccinii]QND90814.1 KilA-N domain-containing protein [Chromobacterium vaccinii]